MKNEIRRRWKTHTLSFFLVLAMVFISVNLFGTETAQAEKAAPTNQVVFRDPFGRDFMVNEFDEVWGEEQDVKAILPIDEETHKVKADDWPVAELPGHTFIGWFDAKEGGNEVTADTEFMGNTTVYARWMTEEYAVTFPEATVAFDLKVEYDGKPFHSGDKVKYGKKPLIFTIQMRDGYGKRPSYLWSNDNNVGDYTGASSVPIVVKVSRLKEDLELTEILWSWSDPDVYMVAGQSKTLRADVNKPSQTLANLSYTYQWYKIDPAAVEEIAGATSSEYVIPADTPEGEYSYGCMVMVTDRLKPNQEAASASKMVTVHVRQATADMTVEIQDANGSKFTDATVVLKNGTAQYEKTSDSNGQCTFEGIPYGFYEVVVSKDGTERLKTSLLFDVAGDPVQSLQLLEGGSKANVISKEISVAANLNEVVKGEKTQEDTDAVDAGGSMEITLIAEEKTESTVVTSDKEKIEAYVSDTDKRNFKFVELTVEKVRKDAAGTPIGAVEQLTALKNAAIIYVQLDEQYQKDSLRILRVHGDEAQELTRNANSAGEFFELSADNKIAVLHVKKFSTYALVVDKGSDPVIPPAVTEEEKGSTDGYEGVVYVTAPTGIAVENTDITLEKTGDNAEIKARVTPDNASDKTLDYQSADETVATVDPDGKVTAVGAGTTTITITTRDGKISKQVTVTVQAVEENEKKAEDQGNAGGIKNDFTKLQPIVTKNTKDSITLKWKKQSDADGYMIYGNQCNHGGKTYKLKLIKTLKPDSLTTTIRELTKGTYYKYQIVAYKLVDGKKSILAKTPVIHTVTKGGKFGVAKAVRIDTIAGTKVDSEKNVKYTLANGKTAQIRASEIGEDKPIQLHRGLTYESSDKTIATVSKTGKIRAKKKGTCKIYVYAQNGVCNTIILTIK